MRAVKFIPIVVISGAVDRVTARFNDKIYGASRIASRLWTRLCLRRKFVNRIDRQYHTGDTRDTALVDRWDVVPEIVVVYPVDLPIHLIRARPIERTEAAHGIPSVSWRDSD